LSDILKSEILPLSKPDKKTTTTKASSEPQKEGKSLFDTILTQTKQINENTKEEVKAKKDTSSQTSQTKAQTVATKKESQEDGESQKKTTTSLLDRMVKEIKADSNKVEETTSKNLQTKSDLKVVKTKVEPIVDKEEKTVETKPKTIEAKKEESKSTSLLDKMIKDINVEDKKSKKTVSTKEEVKDTTKSIEKDSSIKEQTVSKKNDSNVEQLSIKKETLLKKSNSDKTEETKTLSLLDKMVKDIDKSSKKDVEDSTDTQKKETNVKTTIVDAIETVVGKTETKERKPNVETKERKPNVETKEKVPTLNVKKEVVEKTTTETKTTSLMDKLIEKSQETTVSKKVDADSVVEEKIVTKTTVVSEEVDGKKPLQANMFLSNQRTKKELLSEQKIAEVKESLGNEKGGTKEIEKAANTLELNPDEAVVEKEEVNPKKDNSEKKELLATQNKKIEQEIKQQNNMLNRVFLKSFAKLEEIHNNQIEQSVESQKVEVKATQENVKEVNNEIEMVVEKSVAQSMSTRIIESKQKMASFMSDVARNMYLNYKPPVTAFKINLTPANLGNIAIMMRSNKSENTLTVSLNMSQNNTLETFTENRSTLQNNLTKLISEDTTISLEFGMQNDNSNSNFQQAQEEAKKNLTQTHIPTADILAAEEISAEHSEYM
jgi:hypothetical protein